MNPIRPKKIPAPIIATALPILLTSSLISVFASWISPRITPWTSLMIPMNVSPRLSLPGGELCPDLSYDLLSAIVHASSGADMPLAKDPGKHEADTSGNQQRFGGFAANQRLQLVHDLVGILLAQIPAGGLQLVGGHRRGGSHRSALLASLFTKLVGCLVEPRRRLVHALIGLVMSLAGDFARLLLRLLALLVHIVHGLLALVLCRVGRILRLVFRVSGVVRVARTG